MRHETNYQTPVKVDPDGIYGDGQLRLLLGLSAATLASARDAGGLRFSRKGRHLYYRGSDVLAWLFDSEGQADA